MPSLIEWTEETWNPTTGCDRCSPGCDHCYIERTIPFRREGRRFDERGKMGVRLHEDRLDKPLHWRRPRLVFVNSLSDLFHPDVPVDFIRRVFEVMVEARQHTFQVLTKRPQRMRALLNDRYATPEEVDAGHELGIVPGIWDELTSGVPAPNVWLGTSVESDRYSFRVEHLVHTPAAVRFLSCEPLLGALPSLDLTNIDWLIAGGESGPGARPCAPDDVRDLRDRCVDTGVPFFFKQWGEWVPYECAQLPFFESQHGDMFDGHHLPQRLVEARPTGGWWWADVEEDTIYRRVGKKAAGRQLDGHTWDEFPSVGRETVKVSDPSPT